MSDLLPKVKVTRTVIFQKGNYSDRAIIDLMSTYEVNRIPNLSIKFFKEFGNHLRDTLASRDLDEIDLKQWIADYKQYELDVVKDV